MIDLHHQAKGPVRKRPLQATLGGGQCHASYAGETLSMCVQLLIVLVRGSGKSAKHTVISSA